MHSYTSDTALLSILIGGASTAMLRAYECIQLHPGKSGGRRRVVLRSVGDLLYLETASI